jgi:hypothetical protein
LSLPDLTSPIMIFLSMVLRHCPAVPGIRYEDRNIDIRRRLSRNKRHN